MLMVKTLALFIVTAVAEILGCYLPYVWLKRRGDIVAVGCGRHSTNFFIHMLILK
jgi:small multidrug resistance family-3 protein